MTIETLLTIFLLALALSMDAFAVSIGEGLTCCNLNKKRMFFIALTFGVFQALMPLIGYFIVEMVTVLVGQSGGAQAIRIMEIAVAWIAFGLLMFLGTKMIREAIKGTGRQCDIEGAKVFYIRPILILGIATSIDALATGVSLHAGLSSNTTVWLHAFIIMVITIGICLLGLFLAQQIVKLFGNKTEITTLVGGIILVALAIWIIVSHYLL